MPAVFRHAARFQRAWAVVPGSCCGSYAARYRRRVWKALGKASREGVMMMRYYTAITSMACLYMVARRRKYA